MTALLLDNLIPRTLGLQLRSGYLRWVSNLNGAVRSLMKFQSAAGVSKLLAGTDAGRIYDVTAAQLSSFTPTALTTIPGGAPAGEWTSFNFVTDTGVHYLILVCPGSGYWVYDGTTFTQVTAGAGAGQIDGVDPDTFAFAMVYKKRLWFVVNGSTSAWYLPVGQYAGVAKQFDFGPMMPNGGSLEVLINWNFDGSTGAGLNTQLVAIGQQGDVVIYEGEDPDTAATFRNVGCWYVGHVPVGRRFFSQYSADIAVLSERGLCFLSELMRGQGFFQNVVTAQSINSMLAREVSQSLDTRYWEVCFLPHEQLVVINRAEVNVENIQWCYEVNNKAFARLTNIPMLTVIAFDGDSFSGDLSGNVWALFSGASDGAIDGVAGADLEGRCVTAFQTLGDGVRYKRFLMVRPSFISTSPPGVAARLNSEWSVQIPTSGTVYDGKPAGGIWDLDNWDVANWSGEGQSYEAWTGSEGSGRYGSLALRVRGAPDTIFVGWQAVVEPGGIL